MLLPIFILATSVSLDSLGVGISYGIRKVRIPFAYKILMCFFSIFYASLALFAGKSLSNFLTPAFSNFLGFSVLCAMGTWIIFQGIFRSTEKNSLQKNSSTESKTLMKFVIKSLGIIIHVVKNPLDCDLDKSGTIDIKEAIILGLVLSLDAIGVGIGSALSNIYSMSIPFFVALFQLIFLYLGTFVGEKISNLSHNHSKLLAILPGGLLILLAFIGII